MAVTLFLSLPLTATSQSVARLLWDRVVPEQTQVVLDRDSGRSKGFGFVVVSTPEDAVMACRARDEELEGRRITINVVKSPRALTRLPRGSAEHLTVDAGTDMSVDVFRQELLSALDVSELDPSWIEASLVDLGLARKSRHDESAKHQLLRLIDALAASVENLPDLHPRLFEYVVGGLLAASDYQNVRVSGPSADGGIDILASRNVGLGRSLFLVQCKRYAPHLKVGRPAVQLTYGVSAEYGATKAALVTTSAFTGPASDFLAKNENQIAGMDGQDLEAWLQATAQIARQPLVPNVGVVSYD
jgi:hypothetical protein